MYMYTGMYQCHAIIIYTYYKKMWYMSLLLFATSSVSAFYAECPSKRLYVNGTVGTKTKFLGFSVKAQNNGTGMQRK